MSGKLVQPELARLRGEDPALEDLELGDLQTLHLQLIGAIHHVNARIEEKRDVERACPICLDRTKNAVLVPCGHRACAECAADLTECHICRGKITRRQPMYD